MVSSAAIISQLVPPCKFFFFADGRDMGHADIQMTANIYGHLDMQRKELLTQKMAFSLFYISEQLGKETIDTKSSSQSKGRNGSFSQSFQQTGRDLMTPDEVRLLDNKNAIVFIRGERPVIDEKYDLMKHPNVQYTEDGGAAPYVHSPHCLYDMRYLLSTMEETE